MSEIVVELRKWPDRRHYHLRLQALADDEHGRWLWTAAGSPFLRPDGSAARHAVDFMVLVPSTGSWIAEWFVGHPKLELYVHVTDQPRWEDGRLIAVDLDLDVVRYRDGRVEVWDEDEFEQHQRLYGYPEVVVDAALTEAARLQRELEAGSEPFTHAAKRRLQELPSNR